MIEPYLEVLELGYLEVGGAFLRLEDGHVWQRPAGGLLSVGELAGHVAFWEATRLASEGGADLMNGADPMKPDLSKCRVSSPLIDPRFSYYPTTLTTPPSEQHRAMTAARVGGELPRVHREAVAHLRVLNPALESPAPGHPPDHTYGEFLKYLIFHVSYHTGQMYTARHLLGEATPDN